MAEYIDKDKLIENFQNKIATYDVLTHPIGYLVLSKLDDLIYNATVVDVVSVVRCKDCKHRYEDEEWRMRCKKSWFMECTNDNYFCSYGERKENGKEI